MSFIQPRNISAHNILRPRNELYYNLMIALSTSKGYSFDLSAAKVK